MTGPQRLAEVNRLRLCLNCMGRDHFAADCRSNKNCLLCNKRHHTLLHDTESITAPTSTVVATCTPAAIKSGPSSSTTPVQPVQSHHAGSIPPHGGAALLATTLVVFESPMGSCVQVRALLDQGSEVSCVSEAVAKLLRLSRSKVDIPVAGMGATRICCAEAKVQLRLRSSNDENFSLSFDALVLRKVTGSIPSRHLRNQDWPHLKGLPLSDPWYYQSRRIDLLLGADIYAAILQDDVRHGPAGSPVAQRSRLGCVLSGHVADQLSSTTSTLQPISLQVHHQHRLCQEACEHHFATTHSRDREDRYIVRLPLKEPQPNLGDSRRTALQMLLRQERRLNRTPEIASQYHRFVREYVELGHAEQCPPSSDGPVQYFLPHHAVGGTHPAGPKFRVVFNASHRTSNGLSLNDMLLTGPALQRELPKVILRWRTPRLVFKADIVKMFRQIQVDGRDTDLQMILWRWSSEEPIQEYRLNTVTYGMSCAPYLAIRTLHQLASDEGEVYPLGAHALTSQTYVDDILTGAQDVPSIQEVRRQLVQLLRRGGFCLSKWASNCPELLSGIPSGEVEGSLFLSEQEGDPVKILGLGWDPFEDAFRFHVNLQPEVDTTTKR